MFGRTSRRCNATTKCIGFVLGWAVILFEITFPLTCARESQGSGVFFASAMVEGQFQVRQVDADVLSEFGALDKDQLMAQAKVAAESGVKIEVRSAVWKQFDDVRARRAEYRVRQGRAVGCNDDLRRLHQAKLFVDGIVLEAVRFETSFEQQRLDGGLVFNSAMMRSAAADIEFTLPDRAKVGILWFEQRRKVLQYARTGIRG